MANSIAACIFDLDGVIVDTAKFHFLAWRRLANELGFDFTEAQNEKLKGVSRIQSLELILQWGGISLDEPAKVALAEQKNDWYRDYILQMEPGDILEGVEDFLAEIRSQGVKIGLGSASKNAETILQRVGITNVFEVVIDGNRHTKSKPDPEVFLTAAAALGVVPEHAIVFEDAEKGVEAALNGGFYAVGVGSPEVLGHAHYVIPGFAGLHFETLLDRIGAHAVMMNT
ncbi:MAG: beta-phosphoglucomutase [Saprospiraceae bacterium]|nr:beta-phosphoglucomutase [Saprospiraceae bacterium]MDZ4704219.1 beta-phosphoglucomutase [Saprospiraceae bacterium]